jgi:chorismate mutase|tara:strand:- start:107 stop:367 length:261 start_codon:yes stop_codon:yes gene_type:complete
MKSDIVRSKIDKLDVKLVRILNKRFKLSNKLIQYKIKNNIAVKDQKRENQILNKNKKLAKKLKLNPSFVEDIFNKVLKESKNQKEK